MNNQNGSQMWSKMLTEQFGVKDQEKLNWVSEYAAIHEIHESQIGVNGGAVLPAAGGVGPIYSTPLNTLGMGNPLLPGNVPAQNATPADFYKQTPGSGDIPVSTLPMALNVALLTIGLELLPVIPAKAPWAMLSYMDFPYAGGKMGLVNETSFDGGVNLTKVSKVDHKENKPIYFKVAVPVSVLDMKDTEDAKSFRSLLVEGAHVYFETAGGIATGKYKTMSMLDGGIIVEVEACQNAAGPASLREVFAADMKKIVPTVIMDCTHSVQRPGAAGGKTGGNREFVPAMALAAKAFGANGYFFEVHPDPEKALSDGPNMLYLKDLESVIKSLL